jgi:hypothetical protein
VRSLSPRGIAALIYLGVAGLALGNWFWQEGVPKLGATRAGLYLYLEPLATLARAVLLLGEPFGPFIALGGGLVLAGVDVGSASGPRESHPAALKANTNCPRRSGRSQPRFGKGSFLRNGDRASYLADTLEIVNWRSRLPMASSFVKPGDVLAHTPYFAKQAPP